MKAPQTTIFANLKKKVIFNDEICIEKVLEVIKKESYSLDVTAARAAGKGTNEYDIIKREVRVFTPHGTFPKISGISASDADIGKVSGLIYLDLDNQEIDLESIKNIPSLYACWKSLSGTGYSLLFRVDTDTYTHENINNVIEYIGAKYEFVIDENAKALNRGVIISADPDLYYNPNAIPERYIPEETKETTFSESPLHEPGTVEKKITQPKPRKKKNPSHSGKLYLNLMELNQLPIPVPYIFSEDEIFHLFPEPVRVMEEIFRNFIPKGKRYNILSITAAKLVAFYYSVPGSNEEQVYKEFLTFNRLCEEPLEVVELERIFRNTLTNLKNGKLKVPTVLKHGIVNPSLPTEVKKTGASLIGAAVKKEKTKKLIQEAIVKIQEGGKKATQEEVVALTGKGIATVRRHWKDVKKYLKKGKELKLTHISKAA